MIIYVDVKPNSSKSSFEKIDDNHYVARVVEKPINGKANISLIKLISKEFGVSSSQVNIKTKNGRKKIVEILD